MQHSLLRTAVGLLALAVPATAAAAAPPPTPAVVAARPAPPPAAGKRTVSFTRAGQRVLDRAGLVRVEVELSKPAGKALSLPYTLAGSARVGVDVVPLTPTIEVPKGARRAELVLRVTGRQPGEGTAEESLTIALVPVEKAKPGETPTHTVSLGASQLGDPIPGLTPDELAAFERGRVQFDRRFKPSEGLGPFYNATSCSSCHSKPVSGGGSELYRNFYLAVYQFGSTPFLQSTSIPPFLSQVVPAFGSGAQHATASFTLEGGRPLLPDDVFGFPVLSAQRNSIPIFGTGLFEFVSDVDILANADPADLDGDGISGQPNTQLSGTAIGRFGTKAQVNNVELFTRAPLQNQMGITSDPFEGAGSIVGLSMLQTSADPNDATKDDDGVPDPEISRDDLGDLIAFTRFLAPPVRTPFSDAALRGEGFFTDLGCGKCHVPSLPSSRGPVEAYTDLLLHDLGPDLADDIRLGDNPYSTLEFRTQPLWGVSRVGPWLHDGRASTLDEAIRLHGGEAEAIRDAYVALPDDRREAILEFLEHL